MLRPCGRRQPVAALCQAAQAGLGAGRPVVKPSLLPCRDSWRQKAERSEATLAAATQQVAALQAGVATEDAAAAPGEDDDLPQDAQDAFLEQLGRAQGQVTGSGPFMSMCCTVVLQHLACICS